MQVGENEIGRGNAIVTGISENVRENGNVREIARGIGTAITTETGRIPVTGTKTATMIVLAVLPPLGVPRLLRHLLRLRVPSADRHLRLLRLHQS